MSITLWQTKNRGKLNDRSRLKGEHHVTIDGRDYRAFVRIKENLAPSSWILFDRDVDQHTPPEFASQTLDQWREAMAEIIPGFSNVSYVHVPSSSSRVLKDGQPVSQGNGHVWVMVKNPGDIERFRIAAVMAAIKAGKAWPKPRFSRNNPGKEVGRSLATIFDPSVFVVGRFVFSGKPTAGLGLVSSQAIEILLKQKESTGGVGLVLPGRTSGKPISTGTLHESMKRNASFGIASFTPHDFRRTASTILHEQGWNSDAIEKALNHTMKGVRGVYNKAEYLDQRREMLQAWGDYVMALKAGAAVLPIGKGKAA